MRSTGCSFFDRASLNKGESEGTWLKSTSGMVCFGGGALPTMKIVLMERLCRGTAGSCVRNAVVFVGRLLRLCCLDGSEKRKNDSQQQTKRQRTNHIGAHFLRVPFNPPPTNDCLGCCCCCLHLSAVQPRATVSHILVDSSKLPARCTPNERNGDRLLARLLNLRRARS
jgi:hypothetical protein